MSKKETSFACITMGISLLFIFWLIPAYTPKSTLVGDIQSALIPTATMIMVFICGLAVLAQAWLKAKWISAGQAEPAEAGPETPEEDTEAKQGSLLRLAIILAAILGYLICIKYIGFYVVTFVLMTLVLRLLNKTMSWLKCLINTMALLIFIFFLFEKGLYVTMPRGILL